jgi:inorganic pyrophosphatase
MSYYKSISLVIIPLLMFVSCEQKKDVPVRVNSDLSTNRNLNTDKTKPLIDIPPLFEDGEVNALIEITVGTVDKWELDKVSGQIEWEKVNGKPRVVNYLGYPGNYGLIPKTLLPKSKGGDGDPLDIIVLGPPVKKGEIVKCKLVGILYLLDRGEQDDKLIAVSSNSPLYSVNDITDLKTKYNGVLEILEIWFSNYKGPNKMETKGFGNKQKAHEILNQAIAEFKLSESVSYKK